MLLQEMFKQHARSEWEGNDDHAQYDFTVNRIPYSIYMEKIDINDPDYVNTDLGYYNFDLRTVGEVWNVEFSNTTAIHRDRYGITNTGNAGEVFGQVIEALKMFAKAHPTAAFFFTAEEPSRRRLYDAIVSRFSRSRQVQDSKIEGRSRGYLVM